MARLWDRLANFSQDPEQERKNGFAAMALLLTVGYLLGAAASGAGNLLAQENYMRISAAVDALYAAPEFGKLFLHSMAVDGVYYLLCIAGGLFALGIAVIWFVVLLRGLSYGMIAGTLCVAHGISGFVFYVTAILPGIFLSLLALCYAASQCGELAQVHFMNYFGFGKRGIPSRHGLLRSMLVCIAFSLLGAVISAALSSLFYQILN